MTGAPRKAIWVVLPVLAALLMPCAGAFAKTAAELRAEPPPSGRGPRAEDRRVRTDQSGIGSPALGYSSNSGKGSAYGGGIEGASRQLDKPWRKKNVFRRSGKVRPRVPLDPFDRL